MKIKPYEYSLIGERVRQARKAKRYTQAQLAEKIDINPKNVSQLERGMTGISLSSLIAICRTLDVSADYILFGVEGKGAGDTVTKLLAQLDEKDQLYAEKLLQVYADACKSRGER